MCDELNEHFLSKMNRNHITFLQHKDLKTMFSMCNGRCSCKLFSKSNGDAAVK